VLRSSVGEQAPSPRSRRVSWPALQSAAAPQHRGFPDCRRGRAVRSHGFGLDDEDVPGVNRPAGARHIAVASLRMMDVAARQLLNFTDRSADIGPR
jgi:hypothetical protein